MNEEQLRNILIIMENHRFDPRDPMSLANKECPTKKYMLNVLRKDHPELFNSPAWNLLMDMIGVSHPLEFLATMQIMNVLYSTFGTHTTSLLKLGAFYSFVLPRNSDGSLQNTSWVFGSARNRQNRIAVERFLKKSEAAIDVYTNKTKGVKEEAREESRKVLGVSESADADTIKRAYRKAVLSTHPDRNKNDPDANVKFQRLGDAYKCSTDPNYDEAGVTEEFEHKKVVRKVNMKKAVVFAAIMAFVKLFIYDGHRGEQLLSHLKIPIDLRSRTPIRMQIEYIMLKEFKR